MESGTGTVILRGGITMRALVFLLKLLLKIVAAPVILALTLFVWICVGIVYISGLVLGLISMVIALLGVAVLLTCSLQNGIILLVMAFLISPFSANGCHLAAGQGTGLEICHSGFGLWIKTGCRYFRHSVYSIS
jgi:hypothetical protein